MSVITLAVRSGMQTWRYPLPVIGETEAKLMDADALPVLVTKDFPYELLIGSMPSAEGMGRLIMEQGKWHRLVKTSALRHIQTSSPIQPLSESCCHPCISDVMKGYRDVFNDDLFNLGHCNLITLTIKLNGCWPIKLRAYCTPLWIRKVVNNMLKVGLI